MSNIIFNIHDYTRTDSPSFFFIDLLSDKEIDEVEIKIATARYVDYAEPYLCMYVCKLHVWIRCKMVDNFW